MYRFCTRVAAATPSPFESLFVVPAEEPEPARILGMSFVRRQIQSQHLSAGDFVQVAVRRSPLFYSAQHEFRLAQVAKRLNLQEEGLTLDAILKALKHLAESASARMTAYICPLSIWWLKRRLRKNSRRQCWSASTRT